MKLVDKSKDFNFIFDFKQILHLHKRKICSVLVLHSRKVTNLIYT